VNSSPPVGEVLVDTLKLDQSFTFRISSEFGVKARPF